MPRATDADADGVWDGAVEPADIPDEVMREAPKGAAALAGAAVALLMLAWLAIYLFVFLPRGMVG